MQLTQFYKTQTINTTQINWHNVSHLFCAFDSCKKHLEYSESWPLLRSVAPIPGGENWNNRWLQNCSRQVIIAKNQTEKAERHRPASKNTCSFSSGHRSSLPDSGMEATVTHLLETPQSVGNNLLARLWSHEIHQATSGVSVIDGPPWILKLSHVHCTWLTLASSSYW